LSLRLLPPGPPLRLWALARFLPGFILRSVVGGVDVAWRAFHPRLPIDPGWIELPVTLTAGGRVALGAELSLMPGTLVAGSDGERMLIHVLNRQQDAIGLVRAEEARMAQIIRTGDVT
ncbi:MAG TPA: Na+/H+ antiporter subunit E, partial [Paracoccaceae bacterium]|nr:Na+/H+ antiporter subunit E [Paracoccaceae bacterium]